MRVVAHELVASERRPSWAGKGLEQPQVFRPYYNFTHSLSLSLSLSLLLSLPLSLSLSFFLSFSIYPSTSLSLYLSICLSPLPESLDFSVHGCCRDAWLCERGYSRRNRACVIFGARPGLNPSPASPPPHICVAPLFHVFFYKLRWPQNAIEVMKRRDKPWGCL